jgi:glycogen debranching enzyme
MWRGPVWVNINYLLIDGLFRAGYLDVARQLRQRTIEMVMGQEDAFEYYHPDTGEKPPKAVNTFGWSAALFIDLVLQESQAPASP